MKYSVDSVANACLARQQGPTIVVPKWRAAVDTMSQALYEVSHMSVVPTRTLGMERISNGWIDRQLGGRHMELYFVYHVEFMTRKKRLGVLANVMPNVTTYLLCTPYWRAIAPRNTVSMVIRHTRRKDGKNRARVRALFTTIDVETLMENRGD